MTTAVAQGEHPICVAAAWVNALLAVDESVTFPGGRDPLEWALHAHEASTTLRRTRSGGTMPVSIAAIGQVFVDAGLVASTRRLLTPDTVLEALFDGPIIASLNWTEGMELPDPRTHVARPVGRPTSSRHTVAFVQRITSKYAVDFPDGDWIRFRNSRGLEYGDHGDALLAVSDLDRLLHRAYAFTMP